MAAKIVLFACAAVLLVQSISASFAGRLNAYGNALQADRFAADIFSTERYTADRLAAPISPYSAYDYAPFSPYAPCEYGPLSYPGSAASFGGSLAIASSSPIPPSGVNVLSENAFEGPLAVAGQLPFLGTAALEGALPTVGAGAVNYGCGNGNVAMLNEGIGAYGYGPFGRI